MADQETISVYDSQAGEYADMINQLPDDTILLDYISRFKTNDYVLDLGCGPAESSATMREHGLRVDPVDASIEMVKLANTTYNIGARVAKFEDINEGDFDLYNGIWANFSLLHATHSEFPTILKDLSRTLKPKGLLHIGMKLGQGSKRDKLGRFYSYYSQAELQRYLEDANFAIQQVVQGEDMGLAGEIEPWIAITCKA